MIESSWHVVEVYNLVREAWTTQTHAFASAEAAREAGSYMAAHAVGIVVTEIDAIGGRTIVKIYGSVPKDAGW